MRSSPSIDHPRAHRTLRAGLACAFAGALIGAGAARSATFEIAVGADGSFTPAAQTVFDGDTVVWKLADPKTDAVVRVRTRPVIPVDRTRSPVRSTTRPGAARVDPNPDIPDSATACTDYREFDPADPNEFTGPMPRAAAGIFTLGPDGPGWQEQAGAACASTTCRRKSAEVVTSRGTACLCEATDGTPFATMPSTWSDPAITGVFIRLRWSDVHTGPGRFDWTAMEREIAQAVARGKLYSIGIKAGKYGTPTWLGEASPPARLHTFQDAGTHDGDEGDRATAGESGSGCGREMQLGSPADAAYRQHYFDMLRSMAARIRSRSAWYRALAYVKPSGVNLFSHENRAPNRCDPGCPCNTRTWAQAAGYKPSELYAFYREQLGVLAAEFPDKEMAYALIQAGFPLVGEHGEYEGAVPPPERLDPATPACTLPGRDRIPYGTQQTECILEQAFGDHAGRFVVQHNGLGPACGDADGNGKDDCLPQNLVVREGRNGRLIGFQTNNKDKVGTPEQLDDALENGWCNADSTFFEIYEERAWEARERGGVLDSNQPRLCEDLAALKSRTLDQWSARLLARRNERGAALGLPAFQPAEHRHTFRRTRAAGMQTHAYVNPSRCVGGGPGRIATITVSPPLATDATTTRRTRTAGLEDLPPAHKNPTTTQTTVTTDTSIGLHGLTLREAPGRACQLSLWYSALRGQPARSITLVNRSDGAACAGGAPDKTVLFEDDAQYLHGLRVCTGDNLGIRGIEAFAATVGTDATIRTTAQPSQRATLAGCRTWSPTIACGPEKVAVGVTTFSDAARGFIGVGLQCRAVAVAAQ